MEPKIIKDPDAPKGAIRVQFSFRQHFNKLKKIGVSATLLTESEIPHETSQKYALFKEWLEKHDVCLNNLIYPTFFSEHPGITYPGILTAKNIGRNEVFLQIPAAIIISTQRAFYGELNSMFRENPKVFGKGDCPAFWQC